MIPLKQYTNDSTTPSFSYRLRTEEGTLSLAKTLQGSCTLKVFSLCTDYFQHVCMHLGHAYPQTHSHLPALDVFLHAGSYLRQRQKSTWKRRWDRLLRVTRLAECHHPTIPQAHNSPVHKPPFHNPTLPLSTFHNHKRARKKQILEVAQCGCYVVKLRASEPTIQQCH